MKHIGMSYNSRLLISDVVVVILVTFLAQVLRFGLFGSSQTEINRLNSLSGTYSIASVIIVIIWLMSLSYFGTRKNELIGAGSEEYRRVVRATLGVFGLVAVISYLFDLQLARGYVLVAFPLGLFSLVFSRWLWRQWLIKKRANGDFLTPAVIVGSIKSADEVAIQLNKGTEAGFQVIGCFLSGSVPPESESQQILLPQSHLPILGGIKDAISQMRKLEVSTLIVANSDHLGPVDVRTLSWELLPGQESLILAPSLLDVAGPRLHMQPVANLSLIRVETPSFSGGKRVMKRVFDLLTSFVLLVIFSPIFLITAIAIKRDSVGPVFFTQTRVGLNGRPFKMIKFRTMSATAEKDLEALKQTSVERTAGNHILFKIKEDPRITKIGKILRKYSFDELPQLVNVLTGKMSLVGPRPPLASEVAQYGDHVMRKFFMKPGITGQWQVRGRSDLSWDESVREDLSYVENWSLYLDIFIILKTLKAVLSANGAY